VWEGRARHGAPSHRPMRWEGRAQHGAPSHRSMRCEGCAHHGHSPARQAEGCASTGAAPSSDEGQGARAGSLPLSFWSKRKAIDEDLVLELSLVLTLPMTTLAAAFGSSG